MSVSDIRNAFRGRTDGQMDGYGPATAIKTVWLLDGRTDGGTDCGLLDNVAWTRNSVYRYWLTSAGGSELFCLYMLDGARVLYGTVL